MKLVTALLLIMSLSMSVSSNQKPRPRGAGDPELAKKIARFSPTVLTADTSKLSPGDRKALAKIITAARLLDPLFLRQVWSGNEALKQKLEADKTVVGRQRLHYFLINNGPWSRLDHNAPFIDGCRSKTATRQLFPDDMTKQSLKHGLRSSRSGQAQGHRVFLSVRRGADGKLMTVPYSEAYAEFLVPAAKLLNEAAALTTNETLRNYLTKRAAAFASDDYYESDVAWMDLDSPIELTIGPYETYEDELFSYKAAFEAYVTLRDQAESAKLAKFSGYLQELEDNLPLEARYRNPKLGTASPIRVVNEIFGSGEGNSGVQTAAFNLPNDERVVAEKGSKRTMLRNVQQANFKRF